MKINQLDSLVPEALTATPRRTGSCALRSRKGAKGRTEL